MPVQETKAPSWWAVGAPLLLMLVVSVALACGGSREESIQITFASPTATPVPETPTPTPTPSPTATPTPSPDVCGVNPDPAPATVLQVQEPEPGAQVEAPLHVRGWVSDVGGDNRAAIVSLVDAAGNPSPTVDVPPQPRTGRVAAPGLTVTDGTAPFGVDLLVSGISSPTPFCVWVFLEAPEGNAKHVVQVPVVVAP